MCVSLSVCLSVCLSRGVRCVVALFGGWALVPKTNIKNKTKQPACSSLLRVAAQLGLAVWSRNKTNLERQDLQTFNRRTQHTIPTNQPKQKQKDTKGGWRHEALDAGSAQAFWLACCWLLFTHKKTNNNNNTNTHTHNVLGRWCVWFVCGCVLW